MIEIVRDGYDRIADTFAAWRNRIEGDPRELLAPLLADIHAWLVPGGRLLTVFGVSDTEAWTGEWLGATMFFSSFPAETNSSLVRDAGFEMLRDELVTFREPEGEVTFQWVLARST